jgi:hypothetical protein
VNANPKNPRVSPYLKKCCEPCCNKTTVYATNCYICPETIIKSRLLALQQNRFNMPFPFTSVPFMPLPFIVGEENYTPNIIIKENGSIYIFIESESKETIEILVYKVISHFLDNGGSVVLKSIKKKWFFSKKWKAVLELKK